MLMTGRKPSLPRFSADLCTFNLRIESPNSKENWLSPSLRYVA
jgi:hypothetical protein